MQVLRGEVGASAYMGSERDLEWDRQMKGGKLHLFAFIRYTTKSGAMKQSRGGLCESKTCCGKSYRGAVVNGSGMDSTAGLVILEPSEYEKEMLRRGISQDVLDEWSFSDFNESVASDDSVVMDQSAEFVIDKEFDRSESESSDRIITRDYEKKESDENKLINLEEDVVESKSAMEQSDSLVANESVCSSRAGIFEVVNEGSHDKQLGSKGKEEGANPIEMVYKSNMRKRRSTPAVKINPVVSDEEGYIMSILKELNEARTLSVETKEASGVLILVWVVVSEFRTNTYNKVMIILEQIAY
ncbi:hypothetical protein PIB30_054250 [Stylosanthes scabra]|uniref:Uncharacterized protein n=1 Tax=Stylosanthes scabra TaxID=79078 RepID=A0ABU6QIG7_9FABA|nr:hypothetical protein [Stylosanthes scabra]